MTKRDRDRVPRNGRWWISGLAKSVLALSICFVPYQYVQSRYYIAYDKIEGVNCLPYSVFVIDRYNKEIRRGDFVAFEARQMEPFYENGTLALKIAAGLEGDHVSVKQGTVQVNGKGWGELTHAVEGGKLWKRGKRLSDYEIETRIMTGQIYVLATHPRSYDSRYWGPIQSEQVIGRAYPLW